MDAPPQNWFNYVVGLVVALFGAILNVYRKKIEHLEENSTKYITTDDFREYVRIIREERLQMHAENGMRMNHIVEEISRLATRIDMVIRK